MLIFDKIKLILSREILQVLGHIFDVFQEIVDEFSVQDKLCYEAHEAENPGTDARPSMSRLAVVLSVFEWKFRSGRISASGFGFCWDILRKVSWGSDWWRARLEISKHWAFGVVVRMGACPPHESVFTKQEMYLAYDHIQHRTTIAVGKK